MNTPHSVSIGWHSGRSRLRVLAQPRVLLRLATAGACAILVACSGPSAPSSELSGLEHQLSERLEEYELQSLAWDVTSPPSEVTTIDLQEFTQSLLPFVEYVLFGTRFPDDDTMGNALDIWIKDKLFLDDEAPDPYLFTLMNVILHPPEEFEEAIMSHPTPSLAADGFEERHLNDYVWLARLWLKANEAQRPDWIVIRY